MTTTRVAQAMPVPDTSCTTLIEFLLDETGSMPQDGTISGFNVFLEEQRSQNGHCLLTLTKFDTDGLRTPYTDIEIGMVPPLARNTFKPGEMTNLRDAIVQRARALEDRLEGFTTKPNVIFVVLTDGGDNASRFCERTVRDTLKAREADGWTFLYRGPRGSGLATAEKLGFRSENAAEFDPADIIGTMTELSRTTTAFRASAQQNVAA
jgi:hypothetical protein